MDKEKENPIEKPEKAPQETPGKLPREIPEIPEERPDKTPEFSGIKQPEIIRNNAKKRSKHKQLRPESGRRKKYDYLNV